MVDCKKKSLFSLPTLRNLDKRDLEKEHVTISNPAKFQSRRPKSCKMRETSFPIK